MIRLNLQGIIFSYLVSHDNQMTHARLVLNFCEHLKKQDKKQSPKKVRKTKQKEKKNV